MASTAGIWRRLWKPMTSCPGRFHATTETGVLSTSSIETLSRTWLVSQPSYHYHHYQHPSDKNAPEGRIMSHHQHIQTTADVVDCFRKFFTHASPTLFNAGTPNPQMSSCFLLKLKDDSIEGVYDTLKQSLRFFVECWDCQSLMDGVVMDVDG